MRTQQTERIPAKTAKRRIGSCAALCLAAFLSNAAGAQCARQDLSALIDDYLNALSANAPGRLDLASDVKYTENGRIMSPGDGFWQTAGEVTFSRSAIDSEQCSTLTQALVEEDGMDVQTIYGVRLRVNDSAELTDIETYLARSAEFFHNPAGVPEVDGEDWAALVDPAERTSREDMIAAGNAYFDMFFDPQGTVVPFATPCDRWENGTRTTQGDCSNMGPAGAGGMQMTHRRFAVVDTEAGIVVGFVLFADSLLDLHMFKMRDGLITQIQSVIGPAAISNPTGWAEQEPAGARAGGAGRRGGGPGRGGAAPGRGGAVPGRGGPPPGQ
jgi:hypothetical protein